MLHHSRQGEIELRRPTNTAKARHRAEELRRYRRRRETAIQEMGGKCVQCGSTERLELDHIEPHEKSFDISANWSIKPAKWAVEAAKCHLLCRPCHQQKTSRQRTERAPHTVHKYLRHGCRCDVCTAAYAVHLAKNRARFSQRRARLKGAA